jgi:4-carboxymuconolactone decarboxylase
MAESRFDKGLALTRRLFGRAAGGAPLPEGLRTYTMEHLFGDVWQRPGLGVEERSLITCAVLIALGREPEQRMHFRGARNVGHPRERLEELITHIAHYAGWPVAASASRVLDEVWTAMDAETD